MKKNLLVIMMSTLLCVCLVIPMYAECSGIQSQSDAPLQGTAGSSESKEVNYLYSSLDNYGNFYITTRNGGSSQAIESTDFYLLDNSFGDLYPGAVVKTDVSKPTATQTLIASDELERKPLSLDIDIKNGDSTSVSVENPDSETVNRSIQKALKGLSGNAVTSVRYNTITDTDQIEPKLGIKDLGDYGYNIDYKAIIYGKTQCMFVVFDQVYYSVNANLQSASDLYANSGVDNAAEITSADYGRRIVVKMETSDNN